jgi:hypothetical protein
LMYLQKKKKPLNIMNVFNLHGSGNEWIKQVSIQHINKYWFKNDSFCGFNVYRLIIPFITTIMRIFFDIEFLKKCILKMGKPPFINVLSNGFQCSIFYSNVMVIMNFMTKTKLVNTTFSKLHNQETNLWVGNNKQANK